MEITANIKVLKGFKVLKREQTNLGTAELPIATSHDGYLLTVRFFVLVAGEHRQQDAVAVFLLVDFLEASWLATV